MFGLDNLLKMMDPDPVLIDQQACLRARHKRSTCRACLDACPDQAMALEGGRVTVDHAKCSRCGLCAGVCPTAALTVRGLDEKAVLASGSVQCSEVGGSGVQVPCLGWLAADHMVAMGLRHGALKLTSGDCSACRWRPGGERAQAVVITATETLAALGSSAAVTMTQHTAASGERALSRRELLAMWRTEGTQIAREMLPERNVNPLKLSARVPARRSAWLKQVSAETVTPGAHMPAGPWKARTVADTCNGCGICAAFCPTGAFSQRKEGEEWFLSHQPAACVACNTCVSLCPVKAIGEEPLTAVRMVSGDTVQLAHRVSLRCSKCRREFQGRPGEVACPYCDTIGGMFRS